MRILSLLPSTTEIVCALGLESHLVGRSHECDFPHSVCSLPACTVPAFKENGSNDQIDRRVRSMVQQGLAPYRVDADLLATLNPDIILTQDHCEACAATYTEVKRAVDAHLDTSVQLLSVAPENLDEVFLSIERIAGALGAEKRGSKLIGRMTGNINRVQSRTQPLPSPEVVCLEWLEPLMSSGNWFPELVSIAGGRNLLSESGKRSPEIEWDLLLQHDPDILLISPCGYDIQHTTGEIGTISKKAGWETLQAVRNERVFVMDGDQYFHRPGPRIVDSAEILAEIFHPGLFEPEHRSTGWINLSIK